MNVPLAQFLLGNVVPRPEAVAPHTGSTTKKPNSTERSAGKSAGGGGERGGEEAAPSLLRSGWGYLRERGGILQIIYLISDSLKPNHVDIQW